MRSPSRQRRRRINIILPDETLALLDRVAGPGERSSFIDRAVRHFVELSGKHRLRELLLEAGRRRADRDVEIAQEWFQIDEEVTGARGR